MKKILFALMILMISDLANAQESPKNKDTKSSDGAQKRAIKETGVSVKTKSQTKSSAKTTSSSSDNKMKEETKKSDIKSQ